jgi:hypothetical protein
MAFNVKAVFRMLGQYLAKLIQIRVVFGENPIRVERKEDVEGNGDFRWRR